MQQPPQPHVEPEKNLLDWLTLNFLPGPGRMLINRLVDVLGTPGAVLAANEKELERIEGVGRRLIGALSDSAAREKALQAARRELAILAARNIVLICRDNPLYPELLGNIPDPPIMLYCRGDAACLSRPAIAVVGSRSATSYGRRIAFSLAGDLAVRGFCVVSGLALGVDGEAHAGALAGGGETVGVLGTGVDVVYPRQHAGLFREVAGRGALVSEYPMGTAPDSFRFPERNRIISGLVQGVVVVEAGLKSGSLITARLALEQGREVFAVPGRIDSAKSSGTHRLLQEGAKLVNSVGDIIEELRLTMAPAERSAAVSGDDSRPAAVSSEEQRLLACLEVYPVTIDELVRNSGFATAKIFDLLLRLELKGIVRQLPGQQYELTSG